MIFGSLEEEFIRRLCISCTLRTQFLEFATDQLLRDRGQYGTCEFLFLEPKVAICPWPTLYKKLVCKKLGLQRPKF